MAVHFSLRFLAAATFPVFLVCGNEDYGPYDVLLKEVLRCENSGTEEFSFTSTKITKVSRYAYNYYSNFTFKLPFDDNLSGVTDLQVWGNGGWRPGYLTLDIPQLCSGYKKLGPRFFHAILPCTGREDCPIPAGTYEVSITNVSFTAFSVPTFHYGKYKMINEMYKGKELMGCIGMILDVIPKQKTRRRKNSSRH